MSKKSEPVFARTIYDLLSDEEKQDIVKKVVKKQFDGVFEVAVDEKKSLGDFVDDLQTHEFWTDISKMSVVDVFVGLGDAPSVVVEHNSKKKAPRSAPVADAIVAEVSSYIAMNPGKRLPEIIDGTKLAPAVVKRAVAKLKYNEKIATDGVKRATTYRVV